MRLKKRFVAWLLAGVMVVSSVQFPVSHVHAGEIQTDEVVAETNEKETENAGMGSESDKEYESSVTEKQKEFSEEHEETEQVATETENDNSIQDESELESIMETEETQEENKAVDISDAKVVTSGSCGEKVTYVLDSDGVLTISGSGDMKSPALSGLFPWFADDCGLDIKSVVIENGVTGIGDLAFEGCSNLISVEIPESMESIGYWAFDGCENMNAVYISNIESWCSISFGPENSNPLSCAHNLYLNKRLVEELIIPDSVEKIESWAFAGCSSLKSIEIPDSVTYIGEYAFLGCSGVKKMEIPNSIQGMGIGGGAFISCGGLVSVKLPDGLTYIMTDTFNGCCSLVNIDIPDSVIQISDFAFSGCSSLANIKILNPDCSIYDFDSTIPSNTTIFGYDNSTAQAYAEKYSRKFISLGEAPEEPAEVLSGNCGKYGSNVTFVLDSDGILTISGSGDMCDYGITDKTGAPWVDYRDKIKSVVIMDGVTRIGMSAFGDCQNLISVKIPIGLTSIGHSAFRLCTSLESIELPLTVTELEGAVFRGCGSLKDVKIPFGITNIQYDTFRDCNSLMDMEIPSTVTNIGNGAFGDCESLTSIKILNPNCFIEDDSYTISDSAAIYGYADSTAQAYAKKYNRRFVLLEESEQPTEILSGKCGENVTFVLDSDGVLTISGTGNMENYSYYKDNIFYAQPWHDYREAIKSVIIEDGVTSIGDYAFYYCENLKTIDISDSVTYIGGYAFCGCKLENINIPQNVTTIEFCAFYGCNLKSIEIPSGIIDIKTSTFEYCQSLENVKLHQGVVNIEFSAFYGCSSLTSVEIPSSVIKIDEWAFVACDNLEKVTIFNPSCSIYDDVSTFPDNATIYGYNNSTAQAYAEKYNRKFVLLNSKTEDIIKSFTFLYDKIKVDFDNTVYITGELVLSEDVDISSDAVKDEVNKIQWLSTNPEIAEVAECVTIPADDKHSLILSVHITAYKEGIVTITGITANGFMDSCKITISKEEAAYYKDDIIDFLTNKGTRNTLHYLCDDSNFTNSIFVYRNDADFSYQMQMLFSDAIYRGKDGWKDLFTGQTSVEDAEKILTAMLDSYRGDCEELSKAKTAHKYANMIVKAFNNFTKGEAILKLLKEDEIRILQGWMSEDYVVEKLLNQEYDKLIVDLMEKNNLSFNNEVNQALYGFMESKELADSLSSGLKVLDKGLNVLSITQDTFNKFYELESLIAADEMYCEMLLYLKENCIYSVVQEAAGNLYDVIQGNMDTIMQDLTAQVAEWAIGKMIDMAVDAACDASPVTKMIKTGFDWGVTWSNNIFHVGDIQQLKDSMRTEAYIGQCLSMWVLHNQTEFLAAADTSEQDTAAKRLYYSLYMLWQTRMNGEKTLQSLMEKLREECSESYTVSMRISKALESFKNSIFTAHRTEALIGISIACPVDVEVYDKTGNLVLIMKDGEECNGCINGIYYYVVYHPFDEDYVKYLYFGENDGYSLKCVGGNLGLVDCSISGISDEGKVRQKYFENIVVKKDTIISIDNISMNTGKFDVTDPETNQIETNSFETRGSENIAVKKIELSETNCEIEIGKQKLLTFIVFPENAANKKPMWYSDNNNVAVVNSDGVVTAISLGTSVINAAIDDISVVCKITVTESKGDDNTDPDNPDKPLIGDVLPEDIPADGKIPDGLWIAGIKDYIYTGMAIKPEVRVYDSDKLLKAGQDYTISYKNNIKANDASKESTTPAVVIKGKGNYTGTEKQTFKILPMDLNDTSVTTEDITVVYNKKMQKKVPVVTYNGKKLANNKDFTVSYPSQGTDAYKSAGTYKILLTAKQGGNFTGTRTVQFTITNNTLINAATVKKIANQTYTGKAIEPILEVTMKKVPLVKNTDYTVTYANNIESGTATAILTGIGNYAGTKKITFKINGTPLKGAAVSGITDKNYNGTAQEQKITVTLNNKTLTAGIDYKVVYSQNINAGTATVTIKGIKAYSGTVKKTFKITAYDMKENAGSQIGGLGKEITVKYLKGGSKPKLELTFAGKKLIEGTDYTVSCQNNKTVTTADTKSKPTMTIKGKGNFKGSLTKTFTITGKALNDTEAPVTLNVADKGFVDKAGKYISVPVLIDTDGKKLAAGKDYESTVVYSLEDGTELTKNSKVNAGTKVKVRVTGKGAYTGELVGGYQITQNDFNKAKISISPQTYTGKAVTLNKDSVTVKIGKDTLTFGTDYEIVENSYANNVKKGTASVTIVGKGNYGGTKTVKFKIKARKLSWFWRLFG